MNAFKLETWMPGLRLLRTYRREWFRSDLVAGLSVAAVALPIGIAYAQLAGFPPAVGIYSSILPAVAYAIFGSSRQLVVNPDAAACAIVAATVAPLAAGDAGRYADLSLVLTFLTGLFCIGGGLAGLGIIANFLSRPILTGYLNGIALSIIVGQLGTLLGFKTAAAGFFRTLRELAVRIGETHYETLAVGLGLFIVLRILKKTAPRIPAPLLAAALGIAAVHYLGLESRGVAVVGAVPAGFLAPHLPAVQTQELGSLALGAAGIVLVSFCSMMTTARGFAAKNGYPIDPNQDMFALGFSDLASGLSRGFVVSGADSRTAVADSSGGKSQLTSIVAAATMALILIFLTGPLALVPIAALAAILISSALSLFDWGSLRRYYRASPPEFRLSVVTTLGVMTAGVLPGVLVAVALTFAKLLRTASKPRDAALGLLQGKDDAYFAPLEEGAHAIPGIAIYRFEAALLFFNSDRFKDRALETLEEAEKPVQWFLFDAEAVPALDITGADALDELRIELAARGVVMAVARAKGLFRLMLKNSGVEEKLGGSYVFPTVHAGVRAFQTGESAKEKTQL